MTGTNWMDQANCRNVDSELFFPTGSSGPALFQEADAKRICHACPSRVPCLKYAVDNSIEDGVWGGLGELERRPLTRKPALSEAQRASLVRSAEVRAERAVTRTHCNVGHELTADNLLVDGSGRRRCRACAARSFADHKARRAVKP
jgi:WhiB family transcriptional regulator, redox-sensing transcriptional regulator